MDEEFDNECLMEELQKLENLEMKFYGGQEYFNGDEGHDDESKYILLNFRADYILKSCKKNHDKNYNEKFNINIEDVKFIYDEIESEGNDLFKNLEIIATFSDAGILTQTVRSIWNQQEIIDNLPESDEPLNMEELEDMKYVKYENIDSILQQLQIAKIKHGILFRRVNTDDLQADHELITAALSNKNDGWENIAFGKVTRWRHRSYNIKLKLNGKRETIAVYDYPSVYAWREWYRHQ